MFDLRDTLTSVASLAPLIYMLVDQAKRNFAIRDGHVVALTLMLGPLLALLGWMLGYFTPAWSVPALAAAMEVGIGASLSASGFYSVATKLLPKRQAQTGQPFVEARSSPAYTPATPHSSAPRRVKARPQVE